MQHSAVLILSSFTFWLSTFLKVFESTRTMNDIKLHLFPLCTWTTIDFKLLLRFHSANTALVYHHGKLMVLGEADKPCKRAPFLLLILELCLSKKDFIMFNQIPISIFSFSISIYFDRGLYSLKLNSTFTIAIMTLTYNQISSISMMHMLCMRMFCCLN